MSDENKKKTNYEIIKGNISDLEISQVDEHIAHSKQKEKNKPNNIIIPKGK